MICGRQISRPGDDATSTYDQDARAQDRYVRSVGDELEAALAREAQLRERLRVFGRIQVGLGRLNLTHLSGEVTENLAIVRLKIDHKLIDHALHFLRKRHGDVV